MLIDLQVSWEVVGEWGGFLLFGSALLFCLSFVFGRGNKKRKESGKKIENKKTYQKIVLGYWELGLAIPGVWSLGLFFLEDLLLPVYYYHHHSHYRRHSRYRHHSHYGHYGPYSPYSHYRVYYYPGLSLSVITIRPVITMPVITMLVITIVSCI